MSDRKIEAGTVDIATALAPALPVDFATAKPSEVLLIALWDLEKTERDSRYLIEMASWHEPLARNRCGVCLAGAIMAQTLKVPIRESVCLCPWPGDDNSFPEAINRRLLAVNDFRLGAIGSALFTGWGIDVATTPMLPEIKTEDYHDDPEQFKREMRDLAASLQRAGL